MSKFEKLAQRYIDAGIMTKEEVKEIRQKLAGFAGGKWMERLKSIFLPTAALAVAYPTVKGVVEDISSPLLKNHYYKKMLKRYGQDLQNVTIIEDVNQTRSPRDDEIREAFEVGYMLAPNLMKHPATARMVTRNLLYVQRDPDLHALNTLTGIESGLNSSKNFRRSNARQGIQALTSLIEGLDAGSVDPNVASQMLDAINSLEGRGYDVADLKNQFEEKFNLKQKPSGEGQ